jgi:hypothetical protein
MLSKTTEVVIRVESDYSHPNEFGCSRFGFFRVIQKLKLESSMKIRFRAPQFIGVCRKYDKRETASAV